MRRNKVFGLGAVAALTLGLTLSACGTTDDNGGGGDSDAACDLKLAYIGPITGPASGLGTPIHQAAELAIKEYNADADCQVELEKLDSQGNPERVTGPARQVAQDNSVVGVVGPAFSGESEAAGPIFADAGLPTISPSATNPALAENGWDTFHRTLGNDATQGPAAAKYIQDTIQAKSVFVIDDATEYGKGLADIVRDELGDTVIGGDTIQMGQTEFSATVTAATSSNADTIFFGGYYAEAGPLVKQLREGGFEGTFVVADGVKDPGYIEAAGQAADGTIITCPCIPAEEQAVADFASAYEAEFGVAPGTYAAESYDATSIFLDGIAEGITDREAMLEFINEYDEEGITKQLSFDETGEPADVHVYAYTVEGGEIVYESEIS